MPMTSRKQSSKKARKIKVRKATRSQIMAGLKITSADIRHAERALKAAKRG